MTDPPGGRCSARSGNPDTDVVVDGTRSRSGSLAEVQTRVIRRSADELECEVVLIVPGDPTDHRWLCILPCLGKGQDSVAVRLIALKLMRFPLLVDLPGEVASRSEGQRDRRSVRGPGRPGALQVALSGVGWPEPQGRALSPRWGSVHLPLSRVAERSGPRRARAAAA